MGNIAKPEQVKVSRDGQVVVMEFGNVRIDMGYEDALKFSQWVRMAGKEAKAAAGDMSRSWAVAARLSDRELNELERQRTKEV